VPPKAKSKNPPASSISALKRMKSTRQHDTAPELELQSLLRDVSIEFETNAFPIAGFRRKADILFRDKKIAVFIDGCFWHGCPIHGTWPKENADFWRQKILKNQDRDRDTNIKLVEAGWKVIRVWEHEEMNDVAQRIINELDHPISRVHF
jgi:DNA mismatch endonuclease (patch repair protein)